tara:strand:- start:589 stop:1299 length:711 start_codon:yes stop_codon:yes gene_type:complete
MGYLDNSSITVDAVLTKKGREILKDGKNLNITSFTLSDTGVDYTLFNSDHPSGSGFYGEAIENLPQLEASVHAEYNLRNRLITLGKGTKSIPSISVGGTDTEGGTSIVFADGEQATKGDIIITLLGASETQNLGYYIVVQDPSLIDLRGGPTEVPGGISGTAGEFLAEEEILNAKMYDLKHEAGGKFKIDPIFQTEIGKSTDVYIVNREYGAYASITVTNNIKNNQRPTRATSIGA